MRLVVSAPIRWPMLPDSEDQADRARAEIQRADGVDEKIAPITLPKKLNVAVEAAIQRR